MCTLEDESLLFSLHSSKLNIDENDSIKYISGFISDRIDFLKLETE